MQTAAAINATAPSFEPSSVCRNASCDAAMRARGDEGCTKSSELELLAQQLSIGRRLLRVLRVRQRGVSESYSEDQGDGACQPTGGFHGFSGLHNVVPARFAADRSKLEGLLCRFYRQNVVSSGKYSRKCLATVRSLRISLNHRIVRHVRHANNRLEFGLTAPGSRPGFQRRKNHDPRERSHQWPTTKSVRIPIAVATSVRERSTAVRSAKPWKRRQTWIASAVTRAAKAALPDHVKSDERKKVGWAPSFSK